MYFFLKHVKQTYDYDILSRNCNFCKLLFFVFYFYISCKRKILELDDNLKTKQTNKHYLYTYLYTYLICVLDKTLIHLHFRNSIWCLYRKAYQKKHVLIGYISNSLNNPLSVLLTRIVSPCMKSHILMQSYVVLIP